MPSRIKLGNIRFGMRLALLAGIMILIISVISITCVITMSKMNQDFQRAYVNNTSGLVALSSVTDTIHRVRIRAFDAALARDKDGAKQLNTDMENHLSDLQIAWQSYKITAIDSQEVELIKSVDTGMASMKEFYLNIMSLVRMDRYDVAASTLSHDSTSEFRKVATPLRELIEFERHQAGALFHDSEEQYESAMLLCGLLIVSGVAIGITLAWRITKSITRPVGIMVETMGRLAKGDTSINIPKTENKDEIADLAIALTVFLNNAIEIERMRDEREQLKKQAQADKREALRKLTSQFESSIRGIIVSVSSASRQLQHSADVISTNSILSEIRCIIASETTTDAISDIKKLADATDELSYGINNLEPSDRFNQSCNGEIDDINAINYSKDAASLAEMASKVEEAIQLICGITDHISLHTANIDRILRHSETDSGGDDTASNVVEFRNLCLFDIDLYREHLLRLSPASRLTRFSKSMTDHEIFDYVDTIDWNLAIIIGYFNKGLLRGAAEVGIDDGPFPPQAELVFSVEDEYQGSKVGTTLMALALNVLRKRGIENAHLACQATNGRMKKIILRHRADVEEVSENDQLFATIDVPYGSIGALLDQIAI